METPEAVPASAWPALLVDIVVLPALPVAMLVAVSAGWWRGLVVGAVVIAIVFFIEHGTDNHDRPAFVGIATVLYGAFALFWIKVGTTLSCSQPNSPGWAYAAAGAVLVGVGALSVWRRFLWGIPISVLLALVVFFTVYSKLPGISWDCSD